jgi:hypothetical protein
MGKKGKKLRSDKKKAAKKSLKARNRAYYDSLRDSGNNSKRAKRKAKKKGGTGNKGKHLIHNCGNIGCQKCYPDDDRKPKVVMNNKATLKFLRSTYPIKKRKPQRGEKITKLNRHLLDVA